MAPGKLGFRLSVKLNGLVIEMSVASALATQTPRLPRITRSDRTRAGVDLFPVVTRWSPLRLISKPLRRKLTAWGADGLGCCRPANPTNLTRNSFPLSKNRTIHQSRQFRALLVWPSFGQKLSVKDFYQSVDSAALGAVRWQHRRTTPHRGPSHAIASFAASSG